MTVFGTGFAAELKAPDHSELYAAQLRIVLGHAPERSESSLFIPSSSSARAVAELLTLCSVECDDSAGNLSCSIGKALYLASDLLASPLQTPQRF
ncbi:MAG TPA: hypothetical protein DIW77_14705 [Chromatiaceae bacterium]|nr:hypothetical protein [Chromatiaceae bacterium]